MTSTYIYAWLPTIGSVATGETSSTNCTSPSPKRRWVWRWNSEHIEIQSGTQTGESLRFRGKGVPRVQGRGRGDLRVYVVVDTPDDLDEEQADLLRQFAQLRGETVAEHESGLFSRIRSAFR